MNNNHSYILLINQQNILDIKSIYDPSLSIEYQNQNQNQNNQNDIIIKFSKIQNYTNTILGDITHNLSNTIFFIISLNNLIVNDYNYLSNDWKNRFIASLKKYTNIIIFILLDYNNINDNHHNIFNLLSNEIINLKTNTIKSLINENGNINLSSITILPISGILNNNNNNNYYFSDKLFSIIKTFIILFSSSINTNSNNSKQLENNNNVNYEDNTIESYFSKSIENILFLNT